MSAETATDRVNMVPLIDTMFFIIIFFLLVMKFPLAEKSIAQLLPTEQGHVTGTPLVIKPPDTIRISIYPEDLKPGAACTVKVSGHAPIHSANSDTLNAYIKSALRDLEKPGADKRSAQSSVQVHCFSRMPWSYALQAYDAVRDYEGDVNHQINHSYQDLLAAREVSFAPPRTATNQDQELVELSSLK